MDDADRAQIAIERGEANHASTRPVMVATAPAVIDGELCCADCHEPLAPHRLAAGLCVPCKTRREQHVAMRG